MQAETISAFHTTMQEKSRCKTNFTPAKINYITFIIRNYLTTLTLITPSIAESLAVTSSVIAEPVSRTE